MIHFLPGPFWVRVKIWYFYKGNMKYIENDIVRKIKGSYENQRSRTDTDDYVNPEYIQTQFESLSSLLFEVTEGCNIECEYCGYGRNYVSSKYRPHDRGLPMTWDIAKITLDYFIPRWNKKLSGSNVVVSFYGGEPLTNFSLIERIAGYLDKNLRSDIKVFYSLTTNGLLLYKFIDFLVRYDFIINVSLDGNRYADSFRKTKSGKETHGLIERILDKVKTEYPEYFVNKLFFQSVINSRSSVLDVNRYFYDRYQKGTLSFQVANDGLAPDNNLGLFFRDMNQDLISAFNTNREECEKYKLQDPIKEAVKTEIGINSPSLVRSLDSLSLAQNYNKKTSSSGICLGVGEKLFILAAGYLFQCEKTKMDNPLGRIADGKIDIDFAQISSQYNSIFAHHELQCKKCIYRDSCRYCFMTNNNYASPDSRCGGFVPITRERIKESLRFLGRHRKLIAEITK